MRLPTGLAACHMLFAATLLAPSSVAAQFDPRVHGFSFQNYGNESMPVNLTAAEVHRMFGDAVCARGAGPTCTLTPSAQQWMQQTSDGMNGGHCEGMAVLSLRFFHGQDDPAMYSPMGAGTVNDLPLEDNAALQREIGFWFATQAAPSVAAGERLMSPNQVVDALDASFARGGEVYSLGFYKRDMTGGHAVTPFALEDTDIGVDILVYDNNFPNEIRAIEVDTEANTWRYIAAADPSVPASEYDGNATSGNLGLTPMSVRRAPFACSFCGNYQRGTNLPRTLSITGDATLLVQDEAGNRIGHTPDGEFVNEVAGAQVMAQRSDDLWRDRAEPAYRLPGGSELLVTIGDGGGIDDEVADFGVTGRGYYLGVENIVVDPGQIDSAYVGRDTAEIGYETSGMETPDLVLAVEAERADWVVYVRSRGDSGGQAIDASIDLDAGGVLDLLFDGDDETSEFDLYLTRVDDREDIEFAHENVEVPNGAFVSVYFGEFDADGEGLRMEVDLDGDETPDRMLSLSDDGGTPPDLTPSPSTMPGPGPGPGPAMPMSDAGCRIGVGGSSLPTWVGWLLLGVLLRRTRQRR